MPEIISTPPLIAAIALMTLATQFTRAFPLFSYIFQPAGADSEYLKNSLSPPGSFRAR